LPSTCRGWRARWRRTVRPGWEWRSFGWHAIEADGHSIPALQAAYAEAASVKGRPSVLIAHTVKGKGVSFMENNPKWHGVAPSKQEVEQALKEFA
jgi:transketolase